MKVDDEFMVVDYSAPENRHCSPASEFSFAASHYKVRKRLATVR
jgi:hypothetical protein